MTLRADLAGPYKGRRWRTRKRQTPAWGEAAAIRAFYRACPAGFQVDHRIPLSGFTREGYAVSGLHVLANLRYARTARNLAKHNRMSRDDF